MDMQKTDFPAPNEGFVITNLLIVSDQDRSRKFYTKVLGAKVINERDPVILKVANTWLILNVGGDPTDDKPNVIASPPQNSNVLTSSLNIRVADMAKTYKEWKARGAHFLTPPKEHKYEIRCYMKDPDGHLIEVGQAKTTVR
jgi:lactoylglutathione lyase